MEKEYIFYCDQHGKINNKNVAWVTLDQGVDTSTCPFCKAEITKVQVRKGQLPAPKGKVWKCKKDLFDKYHGAL
jgi:hypothetical protein